VRTRAASSPILGAGGRRPATAVLRAQPVTVLTSIWVGLRGLQPPSSVTSFKSNINSTKIDCFVEAEMLGSGRTLCACLTCHCKDNQHGKPGL
ncbi:hypothetical protein CIB84_016997, partial [Bambusicola thoracicus]